MTLTTVTLTYNSAATATSQHCGALQPPSPEASLFTSDSSNALRVVADEIQFPKRKVIRLVGNAQMIRGAHKLTADELLYDKAKEAIEARGNVKVQTAKGDTITTPLVVYDINANRAESGPAELILANRGHKTSQSKTDFISAYGTAQKVIMKSDAVLQLENSHLTTCRKGEKDFTFNTAELDIDLEQGFQVAKRAVVQIWDPDFQTRFKIGNTN